MNQKIIIGTRGSELALWQAKYVQKLLSEQHVSSELKIILTSGDKNQQWENHFDKLEGKNFFTKEIDDALLRKEIDIAVHSFKDVEAVFFADENQPLIIAGLSNRHAANDILILNKSAHDTSKLLHIKEKAKIGTSSARRFAQLKTLRPDIEILPLRGNVPTRIEKLKKGLYDGIILAQAGVERLGINLEECEIVKLPYYYFVPAAGQGIIAIQIHRENYNLFQLIKKLSHTETEECSKAERTLLKWMGGGCSKPIGIYCEKNKENFRIYISFNTDKNEPSVLSIIEQKDIDTLINQAKQNIQKIKEILDKPKNFHLFISQSLAESNYLKKLSRRLNWKLTAVPLIETQKNEIKELPACDWIFFNSKNAARYFFEQIHSEYLQNKKIACLSEKTSEYIYASGISADFIGKGNDITEIGKQFAEICKNQIVLFPCSDISNKSIGEIVSKASAVKYLPVYKTIEKPQAFNTDFDYLIFTSPSNVRAFLKSNGITEKSKIIAMGYSTKNELLKYNISQEKIFLPVAFDEMGIAAAITGSLE